MLKNFIEIIGIDPVFDFPIIGEFDRTNQFLLEEKLTIPTAKPDVEQITSLMIDAKITKSRTITTPTGLKVIINGKVNQKVTYTADEPTQSIHSAHFVEAFCSFIEIPLTIPAGSNALEILQGLGLGLDEVVTDGPDVLVEDVSIKLIDSRTIKKCVILFVWVSVNEDLAPYLLQ